MAQTCDVDLSSTLLTSFYTAPATVTYDPSGVNVCDVCGKKSVFTIATEAEAQPNGND